VCYLPQALRQIHEVRDVVGANVQYFQRLRSSDGGSGSEEGGGYLGERVPPLPASHALARSHLGEHFDPGELLDLVTGKIYMSE